MTNFRIKEVEGVIEKFNYPFSLFKKKNPIVILRLHNGGIMKLKTTEEMIKKLPPSIGEGMYTQVQYKNSNNPTGFEVVNFY